MTLGPAESVEMDFALGAEALQLEPLVIRSDRVAGLPASEARDFYYRLWSGFGKFILRGELEQGADRPLVVTAMGGVHTESSCS